MSASAGGGNSLEVAAIADVSVVCTWLQRMLWGMLEDGDSASSALKASLEMTLHVEAVRKFVADPQVKTLLIQRSSTKGEKLSIALK